MKLRVEVMEVYVVTLDVEAENPEEARQKASDLICSGTDVEPMYHRTLDMNEWPVYTPPQ